MKSVLLLLLCLFCGPLWALVSPAPIHHDLEVRLAPQQRTLTVSDQVSFPQPMRQLTLQLHAGLNPRFYAETGEIEVDRFDADDSGERFRITLPEGTTRMRIEYTGTIHHALSSSRAEQSRGFRSTSGLIDAR